MILQIAVAMFATLAFSILFSAPRSQWFFCSLAGGIGWLIYTLALDRGSGTFLASFLATLTLTSFSRLFSYWRKAPVTLFLIAGIFPLVPGAGIYYTAYYLIQADLALGMAKGVETFKIAGAITLGILIGFALPARLFCWPRMGKP